jgi:signal transduction histidine kinase
VAHCTLQLGWNGVDFHQGGAYLDDGNGFDVLAARERAIGAGRVGLLSMRERACLTRGQLTIACEAGKGTDITADVPC